MTSLPDKSEEKKPVVIKAKPAVAHAVGLPAKVVTSARAHGRITAEGSITGTGLKPGIRITRTLDWMRSDPDDDWEVRVTDQDGAWLDLGVGNREDAILDVITSLLPSNDE